MEVKYDQIIDCNEENGIFQNDGMVPLLQMLLNLVQFEILL